jgi:hypothetical protein
VQCEPLDQTDLKDGVDVILGASGGSFWKLTGRGPPGRLGGTMVGSVAPPGSSRGLPRGLPPEVLWSLLEQFLSRLRLVLFDVLITLSGFLE